MNKRKAIKEHMPVLASDGQWIGKVDCLKTNNIVLTKDSPNSNGTHHSIPFAWVTDIDDGKVKLSQPQAIVHENWQVAEPKEGKSGIDC